MSDLRMRPIERTQYFMETVSLENMVAEDDTVRAIWAFVEKLDLTAYYNKNEPPCGKPQGILKLKYAFL